MQTQTNKTKKTTSIKETSVSKINLSNLTDQLSKIEVKEKLKKLTIYNYPEGFSEKEINSEKGKKFRNNLRNQLKRFVNNVLAYAKQFQISKDKEAESKLQSEIKLFEDFYKANYRLNDFSFESISNTKKEEKENDLKLFISIIKEVKK